MAGTNGAKADAPAPPAIEPHLVYRARLTGLVPGGEFRYRVLEAGRPVFEASGIARKSAGQPFRFVVFGDCGQGTLGENAIAYQAYLAKPDFLFIPGDIVYSSGRISEYRVKFFPTYNADEPSASRGAPLLRSVPFLAAPGNHDIALQNYRRFRMRWRTFSLGPAAEWAGAIAGRGPDLARSDGVGERPAQRS